MKSYTTRRFREALEQLQDDNRKFSAPPTARPLSGCDMRRRSRPSILQLVIFSDKAGKDTNTLSDVDFNRIVNGCKRLEDNPFPEANRELKE